MSRASSHSSDVMVPTARPCLAVTLKSSPVRPSSAFEGDYAIIPTSYVPFTPTRSDLDRDCEDSMHSMKDSPRTVCESSSQDSGLVTHTSSLDDVIDQADFDSLLQHLQLALPKPHTTVRRLTEYEGQGQWSSKEREERCKALLSEFRQYKKSCEDVHIAVPMAREKREPVFLTEC